MRECPFLSDEAKHSLAAHIGQSLFPMPLTFNYYKTMEKFANEVLNLMGKYHNPEVWEKVANQAIVNAATLQMEHGYDCLTQDVMDVLVTFNRIAKLYSETEV